MERFANGVAVVTGSSSGIGQAVSEALIRRGLIVAGIARRWDRLQELSRKWSEDGRTYPGKFHPYKCDLAQEQEIRATFAAIKRDLGPIAILVNNAAVIARTDMELLRVEGSDIDATFETNVKGMLICAQEAVVSMLDKAIEGHVINVNSVSGLPGYKMDLCKVYAASKNAVRALSDALRHEISNHTQNIKVTSVYPGRVKTEITRNMDLEAEYAEIYDPLIELLPEQVAKYIESILDSPSTVLISDLTIVPIISHY